MHCFPKPFYVKEYGKEFFFGKNMVLTIADKFSDKTQLTLFRELFRNFTAGKGRLKIHTVPSNIAVAILSPREEGLTEADCGEYDYKLLIEKDRAVLAFSDNNSLAHAFSTMLSLIEARCTRKNEEQFTLPVSDIFDKPRMAFRAVHYCVFPETDYSLLRKYIRLAGFAKYTHIVLEFWGMFRYTCEKAMYRKQAFSFKQVRILAEEANALGAQIIPMLNHLGHAAQNRAIYGKHCALDQNPALAPLFESDGWTWNILNPDTQALLKKMRAELIEACGKGSFFHIGCDEAFTYGSSRLFDGKDKYEILCKYLNDVSDELKACGRRAIMWGDQLLYNDALPRPDNILYAESPESAEYHLNHLTKDILIADWQYYAKDNPMWSAKTFAENGFDVVLAPFDCAHGTEACVNNVLDCGYFGMMQTTWHLLSRQMILVLESGDFMWQGVGRHNKMDREFIGFESASYLRRLLPQKAYAKAGVSREEIER